MAKTVWPVCVCVCPHRVGPDGEDNVACVCVCVSPHRIGPDGVDDVGGEVKGVVVGLGGLAVVVVHGRRLERHPPQRREALAEAPAEGPTKNKNKNIRQSDERVF